MIAWLIDFILNLFLHSVARKVAARVEQRALRVYLKGVLGVRAFLLFAMGVVMFFQMMIFGLFALIGAFLLWAPWTTEIKALVLIGIGAAIFVIPLAILIYLMSESVWYRASGAADKIDEAFN
jgi:hypothetical protein